MSTTIRLLIISAFCTASGKISGQTFQEPIPLMTSGAPIPAGGRYPSEASHTRNDSAWIYVMGGLQDGNVITANCYRYNVLANTWETIAPLSQGPIWIGAGARLGNKIYNLGGTNTLFLNQAQTRVQVFDVNLGTWSTAAPMIYGRVFLAAASYQDSLIYIAGGWGYPGGAAYNDVYLYNSISDSWRQATNMPAARCGGVLAIARDTLVYVCGGPDWFNNASVNTVFRGVINQSNRAIISWDSTGAVYPPGPRNSIAGSSWGSKGIIVSGGYTWQGSNYTNECYVYSPGSNQWTQQPNLLSTRTDHGAASVQIGNVWKYVNVTGTSNRGGASLTTVNILTDTLTVVGIEQGGTELPTEFILYQNYPNPFNPRTVISYRLAVSSFVTLKVYDIAGSEAATIVQQRQNAGSYSMGFSGERLSSGVYFYRINIESANGFFTDTKKMVLVR